MIRIHRLKKNENASTKLQDLLGIFKDEDLKRFGEDTSGKKTGSKILNKVDSNNKPAFDRRAKTKKENQDKIPNDRSEEVEAVELQPPKDRR